VTALILPGLVGGPCLTVGLFVAAVAGGLLSLGGGALVVAGVVLLAKGGV
jgi:hypothetical protein